MVRVAAGRANIFGYSIEVPDFWIDRLEVTNQEFKTFVDRGGYEKPEYWKEPFVENGRTLTFAEAMARFRDATGRVGPSTWELGTYPEGQANLPVTRGELVRGGRLRRVRRKSAADGVPVDASPGARGGFTENFSGDPRRQQLRRQGPGVRGHASRSRCRRHVQHGRQRQGMDRERRRWKRMILGGGFNEPSYMFNDLEASRLVHRAAYGSARQEHRRRPPEVLRPVRSWRRGISKGSPVSDATFPVYRDSSVTIRSRSRPGRSVEEAADWRRETISSTRRTERTSVRLRLPAEERRAALPERSSIFPAATRRTCDRAAICA